MDSRKVFAGESEFLKLHGRKEDAVNLTAGALELARDASPELVFKPVFQWIDERAAELSGPVARAASDESLLAELSACLAGRHQIAGSPEIYEHADGSFLNRVLEKK